MGILKGLTKVVLSPLRGAKEIVDDFSGENGDDEQGLGIGTIGISSVIKGTAKGIKEGIEDIFDS